MSIEIPQDRVAASPARRAVPWLTVAVLAVLLDYADGFWLTSLRGAVGAIERTQSPFASWLRDSTLMLPVFGVAVLWALARAHRRYGPSPRGLRTVVATALLVVAAGTAVGVAETAVSSAYDYHLQSAQLAVLHSTHSPAGAAGTTDPTQAVAADHTQHGVANGAQGPGACTGTCQAQRSTLAVHVRAVTYASGVLLATNLLLVAWVLALRGAQWTPRRRGSEPAPA